MNEQVKKKILWSISRNIYRKLTDAQVPEKLEKQLEEMDWSLSGTDSSEKTAKRNVCPAAGGRAFRNPKEGRSVSGNGTESTSGRKSRCDSSGGEDRVPGWDLTRQKACLISE